MQVALLLALGVAILAVVFALQNNAPVAFSFLSFSFQSTLAVVIMVSVAAGALASFCAALPGMVRLRLKLRAARRRVAELEGALVGVAAREKKADGGDVPRPRGGS